jgi:hypothetical protein
MVFPFSIFSCFNLVNYWFDCLLLAVGSLEFRGTVQGGYWTLTRAHKSGQFSKAKMRFQSFFMLMTNQPSFFASS